MTQATISLPDDLLKRLQERAASSGVSLDDVIREILEKDVGSAREPKAPEPEKKGATRKFHSMGAFDSGQSNISELASDHRIYEPRSWR